MERTRRNLFRAGAAIGAAVAAQSFTGLKRNAARANNPPQHQPPAGQNQPVCLLRGTLIRTPGGEVPVEDLIPGDEIVTALHGTMRVEQVIRWSGDEVPVVIKAGAFEPDAPTRDTYMTERHALHVEGILIAVGNLINGRSIMRARTASGKSWEYFNIRTAGGHTVLYANGLPCESHYDEDAGELPCRPRVRYRSSYDRIKSATKTVLGLAA